MGQAEPERIRRGVSTCLLGERVRCAGGHKRDTFLARVSARPSSGCRRAPRSRWGGPGSAAPSTSPMTRTGPDRSSSAPAATSAGACYARERLDAGERAELGEGIDEYRRRLVPLTLVRHHVRRFGVAYLAGQVYLSPPPKELTLRNLVERASHRAGDDVW